MKKTICLLNDSFPPLIDGVANVVTNYASTLPRLGYDTCVVTPDCPGADDTGFSYPIYRYRSVDLRKHIGYTAGNPFDFSVLNTLRKEPISLLHSHCPAASNVLARELRPELDVPLIMTYHTKFDIDIANTLKTEPMRHGVTRALVQNVSACDEVWAVSDGAGRNLQSLGYEGDYIVMKNGVDMPKKRADADTVHAVTGSYDLPSDTPVFLFVGRLMWYKGIRIILEAMAALKSQNLDFRMVFVGSGMEENEIKATCTALRLDDKVIFTGAIRDRNALSAWYTRADLFLFPSTFDTNGLVVREAAAASLGTVLIKGSCAAEGVINRTDGLLVEENAASLAVCLATIMKDKAAMRKIGENAAANLYYSWADAIKAAAERYEIVMENYRAGKYPPHKRFTDEILTIPHDIFEALELIGKKRNDS